MHRRYDFPMTLSCARQLSSAQPAEPYLPADFSDVRFSSHARSRAARRNLEPADVEYVLAFGRPLQRTGCTIYFLARRDIPRADQHNSSIARLEGTAVLVARQGEVITVYRNREAYRALCRKSKYRLTERQQGAITPPIDASADAEAERPAELSESLRNGEVPEDRAITARLPENGAA